MKNNNVSLLPFQVKHANLVMDKIRENPNDLILLEGKTGIGKTYMNAEIMRQLIESNPDRFLNFPGFSIIYLTKAPVVQQTREVLFKEFKLPADKIWVCNYDMMRATLGAMWIEWHKESTGEIDSEGNDIFVEFPLWIEARKPRAIFADECQALMNSGTQQSKIMRSYVIQGGQVIAASATPAIKVAQFEFLTLGIRPYVPGWGKINKQTWPAFARSISGIKHDPNDYNAEAVKRLMFHLEHRIVHVKGVRFPVKAHNHCKLVDFDCEEDRKEYQEYYEKWLEELAKFDADNANAKPIMVINNKFMEGSEWIRSKYMAPLAIDIAHKQNKQMILAFSFKKSLYRCKEALLKAGVSESEISIIIGGQTGKERELNKNRYQTGKTRYLLMTLKSGGVGLSLDHNEKNKDVALPRHILLPLPWSAIVLVQGLGRAIRLKTVSDVYQDCVGFRNTVEEWNVIPALEKKFKCLGEVVGKKESWVGLMANRLDLDKLEDLKRLVNSEFVEEDENGAEEEFDSEAIEIGE